MTTGTILMNVDLAVGTSAVVALAMLAVPNVDRLRARRRLLTRRALRRGREQRLVAGGLSRS
jgi:heme exporter protein D